jgi:hypothetical protein
VELQCFSKAEELTMVLVVCSLFVYTLPINHGHEERPVACPGNLCGIQDEMLITTPMLIHPPLCYTTPPS